MAGWQKAALAAILASAATGAFAQREVFSCVDDKGRRLTSDRYIVECIDREQKIVTSSGRVRVLPPTLTAKELDLQAEQDKKLADERQRQAEERRAQRAQVQRYPNQAAHDVDRNKALRVVADSVAISQRHVDDFQKQKVKLNEEAEFFAKDPSKMPPKLKRQIEDLDMQMAAQQRVVDAQDDERRKIHARFDEELAKLKTLWALTYGATVASTAEPTPASATKR